MVSHSWGDKDFDWDALDDAACDLRDFCLRYGRFYMSTKEKYGTLRADMPYGLFDGSLLSLIEPRLHNRTKRFKIADNIFYYTLGRLLRPIIVRYQQYVYKVGYKKVCKKYPHIVEEIMEDAEYPEWLD